MANTFTKPFAQAHKIATAHCTAVTASINTDSPTNTVKLLTAGSNGAELYRLTAMPRATNTAASLVLFVSLDGGTTKRLIDSTLMAAYTYATTTAITVTTFSTYTLTTPLRLPPAAELYVGTQVITSTPTDGIVFRAEYMDF
jgi:hypothetical protein